MEDGYPTAADTAHFYDCSANAVRAKIYKEYPRTRDATGLPATVRATIYTALDTQFNKADWAQKRDDAIERSYLSPDAIVPITATARAIAGRYIDAFAMRETIRPDAADTDRRYQNRQTKKRMMDLYINHRCNQAELELQSLGLTQASAHRLNGTLIGASILAYRAYNLDEAISTVRPEIGSPRGMAEIPERIDELRDYWRMKAREIAESQGKPKTAGR